MSRHHRVPSGPRIFGVAGGSLEDAPSWAANAQVAEQGRRGELATAHILDELAQRTDGPTVIHDVMLPGLRANIDHILITDRTVWVIDAKVYAPGVLWTLGGKTRRGFSEFPYPDKHTMEIARSVVVKALRASGAEDFEVRCLLAIWPSRGKVRAIGFRPRGSEYVIGRSRIARRLRRAASSGRADTLIEQAVLRRFLSEQAAAHIQPSGAAPAQEGRAAQASTSSITSKFTGSGEA
ncbi:nuclease-related domain-containing protein [Brevibacterium sp. SMBL_HHYL_HB1]|uniref:nuclease-related domain-containing protein n=1 Tax=Brevibacterium sp. SMBL_HHYL_HB1 TaxID=2777556 RepID=UPI001BAD0393|nr:nuclease-related domain-containing protein [Brevibacterium sp. SMBL_HHYL_HB1]QUL80638.1 NERD domain-containing protein [Brevibacterium sp. SMBL_HHYL_HB1]